MILCVTYDTSFLLSHYMMIYDIQTLFSFIFFCLFLRAGEIGCPLYNRAEGGYKDCQQRETLRISPNEGTKLTYLST